ncbi:MAG: 2-phospho-L-lactate guanylyltransferase [Nocardioidaceae bacterium]
MSTPPSSRSDRYAVLVPVKPTSVAKSRLALLGDEARRDLAVAFAVDTVAAVLGCDLVARVLVVTDDHVLAATMVELGAEVVPDGTSDLNGTLVQAAAVMHRRDPELRIAAVCADLPALRPHEVGTALRSAAGDRMCFVPDAAGEGTTMVTAPGLSSFRPVFGPGSRSAHLAVGAVEIDPADMPGLRRDVDDPKDLEQAMTLGLGPRTAVVVATLPATAAPTHGTHTLQGTVSAFDAGTRDGTVLLDDGTRLSFDAAAFAAGGCRLLRPGQRVRVDTDGTDPRTARTISIRVLTLG